MGFDAVKDAVLEGDISAVLVSDNISLKTLKEVKFFCNNTKTEIIKIDLETADTAVALGKETAVMGVMDRGFANRFKELGTPVRASVPRSAKKSEGGE